MAKAIHHPHDSIFKTCMGHLKVARSMVEQFIPKDIQQQLNLDSLQICNTDFIDDGMSQTRADMLYRVNMMGDNEGRKAYVYLLWEHQSTYQKQMPLRMLKYHWSILHKAAKQNDGALPLVVPMLIYDGRQRPYPGSTNLLDSFEDTTFVRCFLQSSFILVDLTMIKDEQLLSNIWTACPSMLLKHMRSANFLPILSMMLKPLQALHEKGEAILVEMVITTVVRSTNIPDENELLKLTNEVSKELGDNMRTAAQAWLKEGINQGIHIGREAMKKELGENMRTAAQAWLEKGMNKGLNKGIHIGRKEGATQGRHEAFKEIIMKLSERGMQINTIAEYVGMPMSEIQKILAVHSHL